MRCVTGDSWWVLAWLLLGVVTTAEPGQVIALEGTAQGGPELPSVPVYVEDSPAAEEAIEQARHLQRQGRQTRAALEYQQVIDEYAGKLLLVDEGIYTDVARRVRRMVLTDAELLSAYRLGHEAVAANALAEALTPGANCLALAQVFDRFALCRSGLEAGLLLAAVYLERARPDDAAVVLDELAEHPDLSGSADRWHLLQAAAGLFAGQPDRVHRHRLELRQLGTAAAAQFDAWADRLRRPRVEPTIGVRQPSPAKAWPELPDVPLWQVTTVPQDPTDPGTGTYTANVRRALGTAARRGRAGAQVPLLPLVQAQRLYFNDGVSITALDRSSARPLWQYRGTDRALGAELTQSSPTLGSVNDARSVSIDGDALVAVIGRATSLQPMGRSGLHRTRLVCLDRRDGRLRWSVQPVDLDETLSRGFFHGTPIAQQGRIYVPVRRAQLSRFQGALVVALDASTGKLLWRRYLSSAATTSARSERLLTQMLLHAGRLYVADHLGSVACLDSRTGSVLWLTTTVANRAPRPRLRAGALGTVALLGAVTGVDPPILVAAGLIVPRAGDNGAAWLLDPATGRKIKVLAGSAWSEARYVLPVGRPCTGVLTVGHALRLYDGTSLELRWAHPLPASARSKGGAARPAVTQRHVAVPVGNLLHVYDLLTGQTVLRQQLAKPGNVLVLPDQLILTDVLEAFGYMTWSQASARLRQQIAAAETDPAGGLALAHLALLGQRWPVLLEGLDAALAALRQSDAATPIDPEAPWRDPGVAAATGTTGDAGEPAVAPGQQQVFALLRALVDPESGQPAGISGQARRRLDRVTADAGLRGELFERLAAAATGPGDVVAYRLALGRFLAAADKPVEAVDQYQAILTDPVLSKQQVHLLPGSRQAGLEARMRLVALVQAEGPGVYADYEALAGERLAELSAQDGAAAAAFIDLAEQFPLASTMPAARAAGADVLARQGRLTQAVVQFSRAYSEVRTTALRQRIVGRLVELHDQRGQIGRARQWLRRVRREHPDLKPLRAGTPVAIDRWLAELVDLRRPDSRLPTITLPLGEPYALPGRLLSPTAQRRETWPRDMIVTYADHAVQLRAGPSLRTRWQLPVGGADVALLALTGEQALLWSDQAATLTAVDVRSGEAMWASGDLRAMIERIVGGALTGAQRELKRVLNPTGLRLRGGRVESATDVIEPGPLLLAVGAMVVGVADGAGRVVALDRYGGQVLWQYRCASERLSHMAVDEDTVALAGTTELPNQSQIGKVVLLDVLTGRPKLPPWQENDAVGWLGFGDAGSFLYATASSVAALDLATGDVQWRLAITGKPMSGLGAVGDGHLLLHDTGGSVLMIDAVAGRLVRRMEMPGTGVGPAVEPSASPLRMDATGGQWHLLTPWRAQAWACDGRLLWRDAISAARRALLLQLVGDQVVALAAQVERPAPLPERAGERPPEGRNLHYRLFVLDRSSGAIVAEYDLPIGDRPLDPRAGVCLDHRFVLSTDAFTIVVPDAVATAP